MKHTLLKSLLNTLLPPCCPVCQQGMTANQIVCERCATKLCLSQDSCPICKRKTPNGLTCGDCLKNPPAYHQIFALADYAHPLDKLITRFKFQHRFGAGKALSQLLITQLKEWYLNQSLPEAILPVPLHKKRLKQRGFNQALELAKPIAKQMQLILERTASRRVKNTNTQSSLPRSKRKGNVSQAFMLTKQLPYQHIVILDDVVTTGHTVNELATTLKKSGIKRIDVWCCARTQPEK